MYCSVLGLYPSFECLLVSFIFEVGIIFLWNSIIIIDQITGSVLQCFSQTNSTVTVSWFYALLLNSSHVVTIEVLIQGCDAWLFMFILAVQVLIQTIFFIFLTKVYRAWLDWPQTTCWLKPCGWSPACADMLYGISVLFSTPWNTITQ